MKLLELLPTLESYTRIKRSTWYYFLVRSEIVYRGLIKCDFSSLQLHEYTLSYDDLMADDWEIVE